MGYLCFVPFFLVRKRDIFYEKWGFMLIFWNMAGVPLTYCHCTIYLANHPPSVYRWNRAALAFFFVSYLFVYWIWDTAGSQKNRFRQTEHGGVVQRRRTLFPRLPWQTLTNPKTIRTEKGHTLLVDGWCQLYFHYFYPSPCPTYLSFLHLTVPFPSFSLLPL